MKKKFPKSDPKLHDEDWSPSHAKYPYKTIRIFFNGRVRSLGGAGANVVEMMITEDIPKLPEYDKAYTPLQWAADRLGKSPQTILKWTYDWAGSSGKAPMLKDFLALMYLSKSKKPAELLFCLINEDRPEEQCSQYGRIFKEIGEFLESLAGQLNKLGYDYDKGKYNGKN